MKTAEFHGTVLASLKFIKEQLGDIKKDIKDNRDDIVEIDKRQAKSLGYAAGVAGSVAIIFELIQNYGS